MKKLNIKILLIQLTGMIFFVNGVMQLRFYTVAEKIFFAKNNLQYQNSEHWYEFFPTKEDGFNFWPTVYIWIFFALIFGILFVSFLNWKNKLSPLNTIIVTIVMYIILRLKLFRKEIISQFFNPIRTVFSDDFGTQCLIEGITFTCIGILILYLSTNLKILNLKKTETQI
ncbi:MAG: hypothetical protein ABI441_00850 [Flavobacterium sp.]